jgi:hypothetical protein
MKTKRLSLIFSSAAVIALLAAVFFAPQTVLADSGGGTGILTASGNGLAWIRGNGAIIISGNGILEIRDHAGDAAIRVSGAGKKTELAGGVIRYIGFNGTATVSGSDVAVSLSGYNIRLEARGTGKFILRGSGTYTVNGVHGTWSRTRQIHTLP